MRFLTLFGSTSSFTYNFLILTSLIAIGLMIGRIKIGTCSLGVSGVFIVSLIAGCYGVTLDPNLSSFTSSLGLLLFIFFVGFQNGPSIFATLKTEGKRLFPIVMIFIVFMWVLLFSITYFFHLKLSATELGSLFYSTMGSTPGFTAAFECFTNYGVDTSPMSVPYATSYTLYQFAAVATPVLYMLIRRVDPAKASLELQEQKVDTSEDMERFYVKVTNAEIEGKTVKFIRKDFHARFVFSRLIRDGKCHFPNGDTVVRLNDCFCVVGTPQIKARLAKYLGQMIDEADFPRETISHESTRLIMVTKRHLNSVYIGELHLRDMGVNVTRLMRAGFETLVNSDTQLRVGDQLLCVGSSQALDNVSRFLGNNMAQLRGPNTITIFLGLSMAILIGCLSIPIPGLPTPIKLGTVGGAIVSSIFISYFAPKLHMVAYMTPSASWFMREFGMAFFFVPFGINSGVSVLKYFGDGTVFVYLMLSLAMMVIGALVAMFVLDRILKLHPLMVIGTYAGLTVNSAMIAYLGSVANADKPFSRYATVYPMALIFHVFSAQITVPLLMYCFG